jgi:hypothetical protein
MTDRDVAQRLLYLESKVKELEAIITSFNQINAHDDMMDDEYMEEVNYMFRQCDNVDEDLEEYEWKFIS